MIDLDLSCNIIGLQFVKRCLTSLISQLRLFSAFCRIRILDWSKQFKIGSD